MKPSEQTELVQYLQETLKTYRAIKDALETRNKTVRIKALKSMVSITYDKVDATLKYVRAGGYTALDLSMTKGLYDPIITYLADEAVR